MDEAVARDTACDGLMIGQWMEEFLICLLECKDPKNSPAILRLQELIETAKEMRLDGKGCTRCKKNVFP